MKKKPMKQITKEEAYKKSEKYGEWFYACPTCKKQFSKEEKLEKHIQYAAELERRQYEAHAKV